MLDFDRLDELKKEVGEEDFHDILSLFFEEFEESLAQLITASPSQQSETLHFLKGSAMNIGLSKVSELCRTGEEALKAGATSVDPVKIQDAYDASRSALLEARI
ncbi:MAG: Hpt domain-containing protein [Boseongicola sp.]|nr:Hpt domain-containing protein [Boseongicola sp.]MDD9978500.1 Hpt domain-containing protein [Boseongicola sp.]